jgi:hypothetical protein
VSTDRLAPARLPFAAEVAAYLADCAASLVPLDPAHYPTEAGAVKLTFHRRHRDKTADQRAETQIRAALTAPVRLVPDPADGLVLIGPPQPQPKSP